MMRKTMMMKLSFSWYTTFWSYSNRFIQREVGWLQPADVDLDFLAAEVDGEALSLSMTQNGLWYLDFRGGTANVLLSCSRAGVVCQLILI